jgi:hypothetical protein
LRASIRANRKLDEIIKWGNLVYLSNGPALLIRAEEQRVLLGFWRGQRLRAIDARLKPGGKYEMATIELREGDSVSPAVVRRLTKEAVALNEALGNPRSRPSDGGMSAKPVLLSGGNPQIAKADGDAPVQAYIAAMPGWKRDVGRRLDALIVKTVPGVKKAVGGTRRSTASRATGGS